MTLSPRRHRRRHRNFKFRTGSPRAGPPSAAAPAPPTRHSRRALRVATISWRVPWSRGSGQRSLRRGTPTRTRGPGTSALPRATSPGPTGMPACSSAAAARRPRGTCGPAPRGIRAWRQYHGGFHGREALGSAPRAAAPRPASAGPAPLRCRAPLRPAPRVCRHARWLQLLGAPGGLADLRREAFACGDVVWCVLGLFREKASRLGGFLYVLFL